MSFKVVATESLKIRTPAQGKYVDIISACETLKAGQSLQIDSPPGTDEKGRLNAMGYRNKLSYKIRNVPTAPGTYLRVRLTEDNKTVVVSLLNGKRPSKKPLTAEQIAKGKATRAKNKKAREAAHTPVGAKK